MTKILEDMQRDVIIKTERELGRSLHEQEVDFVKLYVKMFVNGLDAYVEKYIANVLAGRFDE